MTNQVLRKYWYLTVAAVLLLASASFAQSTQVTLTAVGNYVVAGDVYVDPYNLTVGTGSSAVSTFGICDDFSNNSYIGESWTANAYTVAPLSGTPMFGANQQLYNQVADLATQLMSVYNNPATQPDETLQTELSFAIWDLTYGVNGTYKETPPPLSSTYLTQAEITAAKGDEAQSLLDVEGGYTGSGWYILTPNGTGTGGCGASNCGVPQEFLVNTLPAGLDTITNSPESSATVLFGADMLGLLGLVLVFRRRLLRPIA